MLNLVDGWTFARNATDATDFNKLIQLETDKEFFTKAAYDFRNAIHHCYNTSSAPYIALLEGDILFAEGWFARTKLAIQDILKRTAVKNEKWQDLRLFNDEKGIGFDSRSVLGNNAPLIILGVSTILFLLLQAARMYSTTGKNLFSTAFVFVICCVTVPLLVILFFQSGKSSLLAPAPGITVQNWGCCSQALVMPRETAIGLAGLVVNQAGGPPDMSMNDYANRNGLTRFALNPVQVQHIG